MEALTLGLGVCSVDAAQELGPCCLVVRQLREVDGLELASVVLDLNLTTVEGIEVDDLLHRPLQLDWISFHQFCEAIMV